MRVVAGPGHWYALQDGVLVALSMDRGADPDDPPAHPRTLTDLESVRAGWHSVDFSDAFDERNPEDAALVRELREIERRLALPRTHAIDCDLDEDCQCDDASDIFDGRATGYGTPEQRQRWAAQNDARGERDR